jgi:hypothetical protein
MIQICLVSAGVLSFSLVRATLSSQFVQRAFNFIDTCKKDPYVSRKKQIIKKYNVIRSRVIQSTIFMEQTGLALYQIKETTWRLW